MPDEDASVITGDESESNAADSYKEYCRKESDDAYTSIAKNQEEYDKQLLTLSTGLLAVLVAFLKDIVHLDSSVDRVLLYSGFAGLALTIVLVISSFQVSNYAHEQVRKYWKEQYEGNQSSIFPDRLSNMVRVTNLLAGICFITGVALAFLFITNNLAHQAQQGGVNETNERSSRRSNTQDADHWPSDSQRSTDQSSYPNCPQGERCRFQYTENYEIGVPMTDKSGIEMNGIASIAPKREVSGGATLKTPIHTGTRTVPKETGSKK